jgi:hypothetical protein
LFGGDMAGVNAYMLITGTPITCEGVSTVYTVVGVPEVGDSPEAKHATETMLGAIENWAHDLMITDDQPIMDNISFRMDNLLRHDRYVAEMFRYLQKYPRAHPAAEFIRK